MIDQVLNNAVAMAFAIIQLALVGAVAAGFKTWFDVQTLKRDMNAAHKKIRSLERDDEEEEECDGRD